MGRLNDKVAIITGSTEGIGEAAAHKFAEEGAAGVLVVGRNEARAKEVSAAIIAAGGEAHPCRADVSRPDDVEAMVDVAVARWGRLDILVNNAAKTSNHADTMVVDEPLDEWNAAFAVNTTGAMLCCKYAIPQMLNTGGGAIVNSSSGLGETADTLWSAYSCSKAALVRLGQHVAVAYGAQGIRCNTLVIGLIATKGQAGMIPEPVEKIMAANALVGRLGRPEEIANVMAFLASDEASYMTGALVHVDGGYSAHQPHLAQMQEFMSQAG